MLQRQASSSFNRSEVTIPAGLVPSEGPLWNFVIRLSMQCSELSLSARAVIRCDREARMAAVRTQSFKGSFVRVAVF